MWKTALWIIIKFLFFISADNEYHKQLIMKKVSNDYQRFSLNIAFQTLAEDTISACVIKDSKNSVPYTHEIHALTVLYI